MIIIKTMKLFKIFKFLIIYLTFTTICPNPKSRITFVKDSLHKVFGNNLKEAKICQALREFVEKKNGGCIFESIPSLLEHCQSKASGIRAKNIYELDVISYIQSSCNEGFVPIASNSSLKLTGLSFGLCCRPSTIGYTILNYTEYSDKLREKEVNFFGKISRSSIEQANEDLKIAIRIAKEECPKFTRHLYISSNDESLGKLAELGLLACIHNVVISGLNEEQCKEINRKSPVTLYSVNRKCLIPNPPDEVFNNCDAVYKKEEVVINLFPAVIINQNQFSCSNGQLIQYFGKSYCCPIKRIMNISKDMNIPGVLRHYVNTKSPSLYNTINIVSDYLPWDGTFITTNSGERVLNKTYFLKSTPTKVADTETQDGVNYIKRLYVRIENFDPKVLPENFSINSIVDMFGTYETQVEGTNIFIMKEFINYIRDDNDNEKLFYLIFKGNAGNNIGYTVLVKANDVIPYGYERLEDNAINEHGVYVFFRILEQLIIG
jgi:hypothetical protein